MSQIDPSPQAPSRRRFLASTSGLLAVSTLGTGAREATAAAAVPGDVPSAGSARDYVRLVDPWVEADVGRYFFFQSASNPFGMVKLRPDTSTHSVWGTGYRRSESHVKGFSHLHDWQIAGVQVMPTSGEEVPKLQGDTGWQSYVNHDAGEVAEPGYHRLHLDRYGITAELTCTDRVGLHRYTYDVAGPGEIVVNLGGVLGEAEMQDAHVTRAGDQMVEGYVAQAGTLANGHYYGQSDGKHTKLYFSIRFDRAFDSMHGWADGELADGGAAVDAVEGDNAGFSVRYDRLDAGEQLQVKVGLSFTGVAGARKNLEAELPGWDFDAVRAASRRRWNGLLGRIDVEGGTEQQRVKFYTDLFHVLCGRSVVSDADGTYLDDTWSRGRIGRLPLDGSGRPRFAMYNYDALWLTQWNLNTLLGLAYPEIYSSMVRSQLRMYEDGGLLPRGPVAGNYSFVMTGSPVTSFISGAWNKGIRDFDIDLAYEAMLDAHSMGGLFDKAPYEYATWGENHGGGRAYLDIGYVPHDLHAEWRSRGAGETVEYAFQDWTLGQLARRLGKSGINVAQFAEVSVSAQVNDSTLAGVRAVDGRPRRSGIREPRGTGWASGERKPWIKLSWAEEKRVRKVVLSDRAEGDSHVNSGVLWFSDGSSVKVDRVPADGGRKAVTFRPRRVSWVRFEATGGTGDDVGLDEIEVWDDTDTGAFLIERSGSWRNVFDRATGFVRPRDSHGRWKHDFDPLSPDDFVEASSWQATWFASYDVLGLANRLGGRAAYADKLNGAFERSEKAEFTGAGQNGDEDAYVNYGNQPGLQMAHLFTYVGHPWLSQYWVRKVKEITYGGTSTTKGYGGHDEDQGQMGSLSALMAMGLFEVTGASLPRPVYDITSPVFDAVTIELHPDYYRGRTFRIVTHDNSAEHMYIQGARLNGQRLDNAWFHHDQLAAGGELELWMGPEPNKDWGVAELPPSKSPEAPAVLYTARDTVRVDAGETGTLTLAAQNLTDRTVKGTWQARTPAGIDIRPARGGITAPPADTAEQDLTLHVADDTAPGLHRVVLTGRAADSTELPDAIVYVHVAPALSVSTEPAHLHLLEAAPVTFQVRLTGNDAQDLDADVSLELPEGWTAAPATRTVRVPAGTDATTTFTVTAPQGAVGPQALAVHARGGWGSADSRPPATVHRAVALLGSPDLATGEFALSPDRFGDYPAAFPDDVDVTIGTGDPATAWSYIHPGPNDAWAGSKQHTFTLRFDLDQPPATDLALTAWLIDTQQSGPSMRLSLNDGPPTTVNLPGGGGDGFRWGDGADGAIRPATLDVTLPADRLRAGRNTVTLTNAAGSWIVYDAVAVREAP
ncbi:glycoside hydrolase family 92 protein [Streptomyces sp. WMMC500]|uniref:glycoside hydrolase domain-containing protein n=1 Tax=Streptomyces sp. WMMC500 TaxID=3015154 RepID=UPI00248B317E|nr:glycoside hydrolase domain-containing protein [Streptomyces sp. WMMC500]WBB63395.1 glycoside hydrolase family 92 protein [Streptomyces sp. WMMC500]